MERIRDARWNRRAGLIAVVVGGVVLRVLWPTDTWFIGDEPRLLSAAREAWQQGDLWRMGLKGTRGFVYGPFPTLFYGPLVGPGLPLGLVLLIKSTLLLGGTLLGTWWFFRSADASDGRRAPLLALAVCAFSPYLLLYGRSPWDNPFIIALTALGLGAYRRYLVGGRLGWLFGSFLALTAALLTHLMAAPAFVAVGVHLIARTIADRSAPRRWWRIIEVSVLGSLPLIPYLVTAIPSGSPGGGPDEPITSSVLGAFASGRILTALGIDYFAGRFDTFPILMRVTMPLTALLVLVMAVGLWAIATDRRRLRERFLDPEIGIPLLIIVLQVALFAAMDLPNVPHYGNGAWFGFLGLLVLGHRWLMRWTSGWMLGAVGAAALAILSSSMLLTLHGRGGAPTDHMGVLLTQQIEIARLLESWEVPDDEIGWAVFPMDEHPAAMAFLRSYVEPAPPTPRPALPLAVLQRSTRAGVGMFIAIYDADRDLVWQPTYAMGSGR